MTEWWRDEQTEICVFYVPVGNGSHVLTLNGRKLETDQWEYAILQWWHKSPSLWLSWTEDRVLDSSDDLNVRPTRKS